MYKNILQFLEKSEERYPDKIAFADVKREVTYREFVNNSKLIGSYILNNNITKKPIAIFIDKTVNCLEAMMGVLYSGNFYTIIDTNSPQERINTILNTLNPVAVITDSKNLDKAKKLDLFNNLYFYEEMLEVDIENNKLSEIRAKSIDTDPMYVLFTSGSTGVPKGTVVCHKSVIDYTSWVKEDFNIDETTIFGSQTPFYFSMSVLDVFSTIVSGATFYIIPKMYFSFPIKLLEFLKEKKINTIYWVPSALCIMANLKALDNIELPDLKKVLFAGEVMPVKQLNIWMEHLPNAMFANLYGPTEVTDICTYYVVDRKFKDTESLPIGKACNNCDVIIIKDDQTEAKAGEEGELCVRGSFLALGYYNNPEKTSSAFVQNPLNNNYPEIIYKTGDIVKINEHGEIIYISRKDFQIKHLGYRIELGEIETGINSIEGIISCACVYNQKTSQIVLFYQSQILEENNIIEVAKDILLPYMRPNKVIKIDRMPYNSNGKIDRTKLKNMMEGEK